MIAVTALCKQNIQFLASNRVIVAEDGHPQLFSHDNAIQMLQEFMGHPRMHLQVHTSTQTWEVQSCLKIGSMSLFRQP